MDLRDIGIVMVVVAVACAGLLFGRGAQAQAGKDAQVIAQLKKAGSNLAKPHPIDFSLYVPTRDAAERAAAKVRALGCGIKRIDPAASGPGWLVLATKTIVPTEPELTKLRNEFESLAKIEKGDYDGWESEVVK